MRSTNMTSPRIPFFAVHSCTPTESPLNRTFAHTFAAIDVQVSGALSLSNCHCHCHTVTLSHCHTVPCLPAVYCILFLRFHRRSSMLTYHTYQRICCFPLPYCTITHISHRTSRTLHLTPHATHPTSPHPTQWWWCWRAPAASAEATRRSITFYRSPDKLSTHLSAPAAAASSFKTRTQAHPQPQALAQPQAQAQALTPTTGSSSGSSATPPTATPTALPLTPSAAWSFIFGSGGAGTGTGTGAGSGSVSGSGSGKVAGTGSAGAGKGATLPSDAPVEVGDPWASRKPVKVGMIEPRQAVLFYCTSLVNGLPGTM